MAWDEFKHGIRSPETSIAIFEDILCDIAHEYGHTEVVEYFKTIRTACWHQKKSSRF